MPKALTVYELIGQLATADPSQEVHFAVVDPETERLVFGKVTEVNIDWFHTELGKVVMLDDTTVEGPESQQT